MWLMTTQGFYSIVKHTTLADRFMVRSRARKDLENLLALLENGGHAAEIFETPHSDYAYRILVTGKQKAKILEVLGEEIDYSNFKSEVGRRPDQADKLDAYHEIWAVMRRTQQQHESRQERPMEVKRTTPSVTLHPSMRDGNGKKGDFAWMIKLPEYADALFIFNDNESQFRAHQQNPNSGSGCSAGGGNAIIRPYQCANPPRAAGIPTGDGEGYRKLTTQVRTTIDESIAAIGALLETGRYQRVFYSATNEEGELGSGIFEIGADVKAYIVAELRRVVASYSS